MNESINSVLDAAAEKIEHAMHCNVFVGGKRVAVGIPIDELRTYMVKTLATKVKKPSKVAKMVIGMVEKNGSYNYGSLRIVVEGHEKHHARKVA